MINGLRSIVSLPSPLIIFLNASYRQAESGTMASRIRLSLGIIRMAQWRPKRKQSGTTSPNLTLTRAAEKTPLEFQLLKRNITVIIFDNKPIFLLSPSHLALYLQYRTINIRMVILCIDNDPEDIEFFCEAVNAEDPSITVLSALNGQDALDLLASLDTQELPAYIFLDVNMPRMNGKETLKEIRKRERYSSAQIVMLSTGLDTRNPSEYKDLGATHFMAKANSLREFRDKLLPLLNCSPVE